MSHTFFLLGKDALLDEVEDHAWRERSKLKAQQGEQSTAEVLVVGEQPRRLISSVDRSQHDARVFAREIRRRLPEVDGQELVFLPELEEIRRETVRHAEIVDRVCQPTFGEFLQQWWKALPRTEFLLQQREIFIVDDFHLLDSRRRWNLREQSNGLYVHPENRTFR